MNPESSAGGRPPLRVHHVATVVASIESAAAHFATCGFRTEGGVVLDPAQKVRIQFMVDAAGALRLELLEPVGEDSPVRAALEKGGGLNHLCYQVDDLDAAVASFRRRGAVMVSRPVPAPAIGSSRVAFLVDRVQGVFELVEAPALVPEPE